MTRLLTVCLLTGCLLTLLCVAPVVAGEVSATVLARMESADQNVRDQAEEEWDALDDAERVSLARKALATLDGPGAMQAAYRVSPWHLDAAELRLQFKALRRWADWDTSRRGACVGGADVASVVRAPGVTEDGLDNAHRSLRDEDAAALLDLVEEGVDPYGWVTGELKISAWFADGDRARLSRLFVTRLSKREDADSPAPRVDGSGLPPGFAYMARAVWGLERPDVFQKQAVSIVPWAWLMRWAGELSPTAADLPFLDAVVSASGGEGRAWALRHRVRLSGSGAADWLRATLAEDPGDDDAAAHLALVGDREPWDALVARMRAEDPADVPTMPLLWRVDRDAAAQSFDAAPDLSVQERARLAAVWGVTIGDEDLNAIAVHLGTVDDGLAEQIQFFAATHPSGLRGPLATDLIAALSKVRSYRPALESAGDESLKLVLAILAVREPEALEELLRGWTLRETTLACLATSALLELGVDIDASEAWSNWMAGTDRGVWEDPSTIGLHPDAGVRERLVALARADGERTTAAVTALARGAGLSRAACANLAFPPDDDWSAPPWSDARQAVIDGEPRRAIALLLVGGGDGGDEDLALHLDTIDLRRWQERREASTYWPATLGRAIVGHAASVEEIRTVLRENRTQLLDGFCFDEVGKNGRVFGEDHARRLAHNCCSHFQAWVALRATFPTIPVAKDWPFTPDGPIALRWLSSMDSRLEWSPLAHGWLPR